MIGAVRLLVIGFKGTEIPTEVWREIEALDSSPAVRLVAIQMYENIATARSRTNNLACPRQGDQRTKPISLIGS
jgi:hypothetical protein